MKQVIYTIASGPSSANVTGNAVNVGQLVSASFQIVTADATAAGTVKLQMSNDNPNPSGHGFDPLFVPTNWSDIASATSTVTAGVGAPIVIPNMAFAFIRAIFTRTGGTTTISVNMNGLSV